MKEYYIQYLSFDHDNIDDDKPKKRWEFLIDSNRKVMRFNSKTHAKAQIISDSTHSKWGLNPEECRIIEGKDVK